VLITLMNNMTIMNEDNQAFLWNGFLKGNAADLFESLQASTNLGVLAMLLFNAACSSTDRQYATSLFCINMRTVVMVLYRKSFLEARGGDLVKEVVRAVLVVDSKGAMVPREDGAFDWLFNIISSLIEADFGALWRKLSAENTFESALPSLGHSRSSMVTSFYCLRCSREQMLVMKILEGVDGSKLPITSFKFAIDTLMVQLQRIFAPSIAEVPTTFFQLLWYFLIFESIGNRRGHCRLLVDLWRLVV